jgi:hypothetical protein
MGEETRTVDDVRREYASRRWTLRMDHEKSVLDRDLELERWRLRVYTKIADGKYSAQADKCAMHGAIRREYEKRRIRLRRAAAAEEAELKRTVEALDRQEAAEVEGLEEPTMLRHTAPSA